MVDKLLYFDTAASTPVANEVIQKMMSYLGSEGVYANPSSAHALGREAEFAITDSRKQVAQAFACLPNEVIFTSGATESINLALTGIALAHKHRGKHIITSSIEHKAVLACCEALEAEGFAITYLEPDAGGVIQPDNVMNAVREDTLLVSLIHTNNETGVQQPIQAIAHLLADAGVMFHVDAAQAAGKFLINLKQDPIDLLSFSAHKFYGPKGVGGLVVRNRRQLKLKPLQYGGGQEFNLRSGTSATHQIIGLAEALRLCLASRASSIEHVSALKQQFITQLAQYLPLQIHGNQSCCSPYILNVSIKGIGSEMLINQLYGSIAIASGSACSSGTIEPSYVLRAMRVDEEALYGAVRISFSPHHTQKDITHAVNEVMAAVKRIKELL